MGSLDLIDYVALQKRGLIKKQQSSGKLPISKDGYIDLGAANQELVNDLNNQSAQSTQSTPSTISPLDNNTSSTASTHSAGGFTSFWDQLPGQTSQPLQASTTETSYHGSQSDTSSTFSSPPASDNSELATLKVKLDDLEYKLARLTEKLDMISSKL